MRSNILGLHSTNGKVYEGGIRKTKMVPGEWEVEIPNLRTNEPTSLFGFRGGVARPQKVQEL